MDIMAQTMDKCEDILTIENIKYDKKVLAQFIQKISPDFRKCLNELQLYSLTGSIDEGILDTISTKVDVLIECIMRGDFRACRKWILHNTYDATIYSAIMNKMYTEIKDGQQKATAIVLSNDYQYKHSFAVDPDLNLAAYIVELMGVFM